MAEKVEKKKYRPKEKTLREWMYKYYPKIAKKLDRNEPVPRETLKKLAIEYNNWKKKKNADEVMKLWKKSKFRTWMQKHYPKSAGNVDKGEKVSSKLQEKIGAEYQAWRKKEAGRRQEKEYKKKKKVLSLPAWRKHFDIDEDMPLDEQTEAYRRYLKN